MFNGINVLIEINGDNPNSFGRNLFTEMFDGRNDLIVTDDGRQPSNSTRTPIPVADVNFIKSNLYFINLSQVYSCQGLPYLVSNTKLRFAHCLNKN